MVNNIPNQQSFEQAGVYFAKGIANVITESFADLSIKDKVVQGVTQVAKEIFSNISIEQFGSNLNELVKGVLKGAGWNGSEFGAEFNSFFRDFIKNLNTKEFVGDFMKEISKAFKEGVTQMDLAGNMGHLAAEFDAGMGVFRENFFKQFDLLRGDVQSIFTNMARDTTLKTIPWIALGGVILVGAPLLTSYVYKKAVYNIGRPKLAREVRRVNLWDCTTDRIARIVSSVWNSTKKGIKWSILAGTAGAILTIFGEAAWEIKTGKYGSHVIEGLGCAISGSRYCDSSSAFPLIAATVGIGVLRGSAGVASSFYGFVKKAIKKDDKPIFNDELQKRIDDLTKATYNVKRNGGYMQNLLLYGPGGTGKTMISKYIAKHSNMNYVMMSGGDLAQYIKRGEHVTELNKLFEGAKSFNSPTILFIDECESLCGDRGKMDRSELIELVNSFLNQTGEPSKKVMVILATNRKDDLDPAVLSRIDHKLYVGPPQEAERKKIIELYLPTFMTSLERKELFTDKLISRIANKTKEFTGRTIFKMLNAISAMRATTDNNKLTEKMIIDAVNAFVKQEADVLKKSASKSSWISLPTFLRA